MLTLSIYIHLNVVFASHAYKTVPYAWQKDTRKHYECFFCLFLLLCFVYISQVHRLYRGGGGSMQRAQEEWSNGVWKSAPVREAGFNAVSQAAQGPSLPQYPTTVPSYPSNSQWWWLRVTCRWRQMASHFCCVQESVSEFHIILVNPKCMEIYFKRERIAIKVLAEFCQQTPSKCNTCLRAVSLKCPFHFCLHVVY